jgi:hypothetical protein
MQRDDCAMTTPVSAWSTGPTAPVRARITRIPTWLCARKCGGAFDHGTGRIVDAPLAEADRMRERLALAEDRGDD